MKKKLFSIGLCTLILFSLTGCKNQEEVEIEGSTLDYRFQKIKQYDDVCTYYDKETGYIYFRDYGGYQGGYTILLNKDGKPYKYEGWDK